MSIDRYDPLILMWQMLNHLRLQWTHSKYTHIRDCVFDSPFVLILYHDITLNIEHAKQIKSWLVYIVTTHLLLHAFSELCVSCDL